ncbi:MAG: DNA sulfur modification protein DndE [Methyloprofundus sp.]|nr:DNA sulfur modification protein DndE [Methyloprofundus sp.]
MQDIDTIRLSEKQKQQLIRLKTKTGIENWNVLCRWAICLSFSDPTTPPKEDIPSNSNIEMTWKTFTGEYHQIYQAIITMQHQEQMPEMPLIDFIKLHISRGLSALSKSDSPI